MTDFSESIGFDDSLDLSSTDGLTDQSELIPNGSINGSFYTFNKDFRLSQDGMRFLFLAITAITLLICLTISISVCICIYLNRRRRGTYQKTKDRQLLSVPSEKTMIKKISMPKTINVNGNQHLSKKMLSSSTSTITEKAPIKSFYYDNLDDIPFIDESRPTSFIELTRV